MKILLLGYGKMGKETEAVALRRGHVVAGRVGGSEGARPGDGHFPDADVAIEFTRPDAAAGNLLRCFDAGLPVVTGTTGWYDRLPEVEQACRAKQGALLYASNFSIGVHMLFDLNRRLAALMNARPEYDAGIEEVHHVHKRDKPSGTALTLAGDMVDALDRKSRWHPDDGRPGAGDSIPIRSIREDEVTGIHRVRYRSGTDQLEISHEAFNRGGFAAGAVLGAEWLKGRTGVFTMQDFLDSLTQL